MSASSGSPPIDRCTSCGQEYDRGTVHRCPNGSVSTQIPGMASTAPAIDPLASTNAEIEATVDLARAAELQAPSSKSREPKGAWFPERLIGTVLGERYRLEKIVGRGGMGVVFVAEHITLKTKMAVKLLRAGGSTVSRRRFMREAQLASKIRHPNVVFIADYGLLPDDSPYLVMEYVSGETLSDALKEGRLDPMRACQIAAEIARGMQAVHDQGIVHRDLKPGNLFLIPREGQAEQIKIVDFGIAKDFRAAQSSRSTSVPPIDPATPPVDQRLSPEMPSGPLFQTRDPDDSAEEEEASGDGATRDPVAARNSLGEALTRAGVAVGTPQYMAPEQINEPEVDAAADQYALGCILYQMLTGTLPFLASSATEVMQLHLLQAVDPPRHRCPGLEISDVLEEVVLRALAKHPADRFPNMAKLAEVLDREVEKLQVARGEKVTARASLLAPADQNPLRAPARPRLPWVAIGLAGFTALSVVGAGTAYLLVRGRSAVKSDEDWQKRALSYRAPALAALVADLRSPVPTLRAGAVAGLGISRDVSLRSTLEPLLADPQPLVQAQAADALGQLGDHHAAPALFALVGSSSVGSVRVAAGRALELLGDERGGRWLREALAGSDPDLKLRSAFVLAERGDEKAQTLLSQWLEQGKLPEPMVLGTLAALAQSGSGAARDKLRTRMQNADQPVEDRMAAAARLWALGESEAQTFLRGLLGSEGPNTLLSARFLAAPGESAATERLRRAVTLTNPDAAARLLAVEGLGFSGELRDVEPLQKLLVGQPDPALRQAAAIAIVRLTQGVPGVLSARNLLWARTALDNDSWLLRSSAVLALADSPEQSDEQRIVGLLTDRDPQVRRSAMRALLARPKLSAIELLRPALRDEDAEVRRDAWRQLSQAVRTRPELLEKTTTWAQELLRGASATEQVILRAALLRMGDEGQRQQIAALASASDPQVRRLIVDQLDGDRRTLLGLLQDVVFTVRFASARRLAELGDKLSIPVLREALERGGTEAVRAYSLLRRLGEPAQLPAGFTTLSRIEAPAERAALIESIPAAASEVTLGWLAQGARDPDASVRVKAAESAFGLVGTEYRPRALAVLRQLAEDANPAVRGRAVALLGKLPPAAPSPESAAPKEDTTSAASDGGSAPEAPPKGAPDLGSPGPDEATEPAAADRIDIPDLVKRGVAALDRNDGRRALKLLSKANSLCARPKEPSCGELRYEIAFQLGRYYQQQGQLAEAMTELTRAQGLHARGAHSQEIDRTIVALAPRLGRILLAKAQRGHCRKVTLWVPPGRHQIETNGATQQFQVKAGETVEVGSCP